MEDKQQEMLNAYSSVMMRVYNIQMIVFQKQIYGIILNRYRPLRAYL